VLPDAARTERGKLAGWIAPPRNGINGRPFDCAYVRLARPWLDERGRIRPRSIPEAEGPSSCIRSARAASSPLGRHALLAIF
jgi:hypothetical protein